MIVVLAIWAAIALAILIVLIREQILSPDPVEWWAIPLVALFWPLLLLGLAGAFLAVLFERPW